MNDNNQNQSRYSAARNNNNDNPPNDIPSDIHPSYYDHLQYTDNLSPQHHHQQPPPNKLSYSHNQQQPQQHQQPQQPQQPQQQRQQPQQPQNDSNSARDSNFYGPARSQRERRPSPPHPSPQQQQQHHEYPESAISNQPSMRPRRVQPPFNAKPAPYHQSSGSSKMSSAISSDPTKYHYSSSSAQTNNQQQRPPVSHSAQYHQYPHDYPEYMQHALQQEEDEKYSHHSNQRRVTQQYAPTEPQNNYQYQQRHNLPPNHPSYPSYPHGQPPNHNQRQRHRNGPYATSEQQHYRGRNQRREIAADPHSLQRISCQLPRRPHRPFLCDANIHSSYHSNSNSKGLFPIRLKSNSAEIKFRCEELIKYDIEFIPNVAEDAKQIRRNAINQCYAAIHQIYGTFFDDNTRIYAVGDIKETNEFQYGDNRKIVLKYGQKLKIQALDLQYKKQIQGIILQSLVRKADLRRFGRGHYDMNKQARLPIRGPSDKFPKNLSLLPGYRTSLETTVSGIMIGIDTCHRLIEDRTVQELMDAMRDEVERANYGADPQFIDQEWMNYVKKKLRGRHVQAFTNGKLFRIDDIDFELSINSTVPNNRDGITIRDHWQTQYDVQLVNETPGMIIHISKLKKNEQQNKYQFIPPEICCLTGFGAEHRNQRSVTTSVSKATKIPAQHRMKSAEKLVSKFAQITKMDPDIKPFVEIPEHSTKEIQAQVLKCPEILLNAGIHPETRQKRFQSTGPENLQFDWKQCSFMEKGSKITEWAVVYNQQEHESVHHFIDSLRVYARNGGFEQAVDVQTCAYIEIPNNDKFTWKNVLNQEIDAINHRNLQNGGKLLQAIIAIIPHYPQRVCDRIYAQIKEICSTQRAILSQCILAKHTSKNHVINGVLRQLLVKLGSIPWKIKFNLPYKRLDIETKPTMIIGINVNHAQKSNISAVGFAASFDRDFVRYFSRVIHQKQGTECIAFHDLCPVIEQSLDNFKSINECLPQQIIVFRDGISETQIEQCVNTELRAFKNVINLPQYQAYGIGIEFLCVQKRVNARFLISRNLESAPPGTAVNDVVVSNQFWDFYLVPSKPPPKCVAIPTRCIVIEDGLRLSDEDGKGEMDLMHLTNSLCTLYFNWPGPTRVPAPIKYAQKIAQQYCQTLPQKQPHHLLDCSYHFL